MASIAVSTPSPPSRVHTPGSPKHGYSDSWEPFSPRKSARISSQRATNRTPSPRASSHSITRTSRKSSATFSTPATSPRKKRLPAMDSVRRSSGTLTAEGTANAADSLGLPPKSAQHKSAPSATASRAAGMLFTPAKTPSKKSDEKTQANVRSVARNLFHADNDTMSGSRKKQKKYSGLTLESFTAEDVDDPIQIFTDSRDRFPEKDAATENPFYGEMESTTAVPDPAKRRTRRRQVTIPGEGRETIEEAVQRDDGIVYVFRGKKIFRKFSESNESNSGGQPETEEDIVDDFAGEQERNRPMTRSSIKPRLLFPPNERAKATTSDEDEEAATDIEDHLLRDADIPAELPGTPVQADKPNTPQAPRFGPASPPTTARTTRLGNKLQADDSPMKRPVKARSPFDGWRRSKSRAEPHGLKREGDAIAAPQETSKRQRS